MRLVDWFRKQQANYLHMMDEPPGGQRWTGRVATLHKRSFTSGLQGCLRPGVSNQLGNDSPGGEAVCLCACLYPHRKGDSAQRRKPLRKEV